MSQEFVVSSEFLKKDELLYSALNRSVNNQNRRSQWQHGLRRRLFWDCGLESRRGHACLSVVNVVYCQVDVHVRGRSLVQKSPTECGVSE
jgi:hypothetical protein